MLLNDMRIIHQFVLRRVTEKRSNDCLECLFRAFESLEILQSDSLSEARFVHDAVMVLNENDIWIPRTIEKSLGADNVCVLSYLSALHEVIESCWEQTYQLLIQPESALAGAREPLQQLRGRLCSYPFRDQLNVIERHWQPNCDTIVDVLVLHLLWRCARLGVVGERNLYESVTALLSLEQPFIVVYLAAACLKTERVSTIYYSLRYSEEQYGCVRMLYTFGDLPGVDCG